MATVNFILKHPKAKILTPVIMVFAFGKKNIKIQIGQKVKPRAWNQEKARLRIPRNNDDNEITNFNNRLASIEKSILAQYNSHLTRNGTLYIDKLKNEFKALIRPSGINTTDTLNLIKAGESLIATLNPKSWTTKHYFTTLNVLKRFQNETGKIISLEDVNMDFYNAFVHWCETVPYDKEGNLYSLNSIGSHIKEIKVFMNYAYDKGWTTNMGHKHKKFKVMEETSDSIAIYVDKIYQIYNVDLSQDPRL